MIFNKYLVTILGFFLVFSFLSPIGLAEENDTTFLTLTNIIGNYKDSFSFRLNQNIISYFVQTNNSVEKPEAPYFHQGLLTDVSYVYFCDKGESEIEVYDFLGNPIRTIGSVGNDDGQFQVLADISMDDNGNLYALDSFKNSIQIFDKFGNYAGDFSLERESDKKDPLPVMMTLSNDQNLFVLDLHNGGKIFSKKGKWIGKFSHPFANKMNENPFQFVTDICSDDKGLVYLLDNIPVDGCPYFWIYGADGNILHTDPISLMFGDDERSWNFCPSFSYFDSKFYMSMMTEFESRIEKTDFRSSCIELTFEQKSGKDGSIFIVQSKSLIEEFLQFPVAVTKTRTQVIGLDSYDNRLVYFDQKGKVSKEIKSTNKSQLLFEPCSVEADITGTIYTCDPTIGKIIKLNPAKNEVSMINSNNAILGYFQHYEGKLKPCLSAVDHFGNTYYYDDHFHAIHVLDTNNKLIRSIDIEHDSVNAMDFNSAGDLLILVNDGTLLEGTDVLVEIYEASRGPKNFTKRKTFEVPCYFASDLSVGGDDKMYVTSFEKVFVFSMKGEKLGEWEFKDKNLDKVYVAPDNSCYLLVGSEVIKTDDTGKILNQQDLELFRTSDISGNMSGEILITDDFHGLLLTYKDNTLDPKLNPTPLLIGYVTESTNFNSVEIQGRSIPESILKINGKPCNINVDGSFLEKIPLTPGSNEIKVSSKSIGSIETTKNFMVKMKPQKVVTLTIGQIGATKMEAFIEKETKRTYVPLRYLLETMEGTVVWDSKPQKITYTNEFVKLEMLIGIPRARVNGKVQVMDPDFPTKVFPKIINQKTYVPLRFLAENLGYKVVWDAKKNQITLTFPDEKFVPQVKIEPPEDFDSIEWSKQYGISSADFSGLTATKNGFLSMVNYINRSDADFWFLQVDSAGKPTKSLLYTFPHYWNESIDFKVNDNQIFSAFVKQNKEQTYFNDLAKDPFLLNYCSLDLNGKILESKTLSLTSKQPMRIEFGPVYTLSKNRYMISFGISPKKYGEKGKSGFLTIDSQGKLLNSFTLSLDQEEKGSNGQLFSVGNDSFVYLIQHGEQTKIESLELVGINATGETTFKTVFQPKITNYLYPEVIPCQKGFLLKISDINNYIFYFLRFSENGTVLWQK